MVYITQFTKVPFYYHSYETIIDGLEALYDVDQITQDQLIQHFEFIARDPRLTLGDRIYLESIAYVNGIFDQVKGL